MLKVLGNPDPGMIIGGYLGALFLGAFFLAIGIFISGICRDQIVAFILSMIVCFGIHLTGTEFLASSIDGWVPGFGSFLRNFIGSTGHFDSFAKGVIDNRDLLYFVTGTVIFLVLNGFWFEGRMKPGAKKIFTAAVVISIAIFLVSNWLLSSFSLGRFDLTQGKIYTTSPATQKILAELKAPVMVKFYVSPSDKMPTGMKTLEQDTVAKLDELRIASKGKFQYKVFHMEAANVAEGDAQNKEESLEQQLQRKGIQPFQVRAIESDEVAVRLIYSALSIAYKEKPEEIIPRLTLDNFNELEYTLASKIFRMTLAEAPKLAMVAPYSEKPIEPGLMELVAQLGGNVPEAYREDNYELLQMALRYEGYEINRIKLSEDEPIPAGTKTLILLEPENLSDRQRYEISKFISHGGSLFLGVQNYFYGYEATGQDLRITPDPKDPGINPLLAIWGFEVDDKILVDEQHDVISLGGAARMGPFEIAIPVKVPIQILIDQAGMNADVSVTSRLSPLFYLWGTALKLNDEKIKTQNLKVETLLRSSAESWTVPSQQGALSPDHLIRQPESPRGPFPLAVMAQGQFTDMYEGKEPPAWPLPEPKEGQSPEDAALEKVTPKESVWPSAGPAPGKMILVGAVTLFQKHLIRSGGHLNFFLNAVDALTLGDDLVTIRSKQPIDRSIGRVSAASKILWRFFVTLLVPVIFALIGFLKVLWRRKAKQDYIRDFALTR
jgi:ABC-2 type transport system permease protein